MVCALVLLCATIVAVLLMTHSYIQIIWMELQIFMSCVIMDRYIISRIDNKGRRQFLRRVIPAWWSDHECNALPMSDKLSMRVLAFHKKINPYGVFERQKYRPPKLPEGEASPK